MSGEWTPLATDFFSHPDVRAAGRDASLLYLAGLCYAQHHLTDGVVSDDAVSMLAASAWVKPSVAGQLARVGLWDRLEGGWFVVDWFKWNKTAAQVEALRERERTRKKGWRDAKEARRAEDVVRDASRDVAGTGQSRSAPSPTPTYLPTEAKGGSPQPVDNVARVQALREAL